LSLPKFWAQRQWPLLSVSVVVLLMALWLVVEALLSFARGRGEVVLEESSLVGEASAAAPPPRE